MLTSCQFMAEGAVRRPSGRLIPKAAQSKFESVCGESVPEPNSRVDLRSLSTSISVSPLGLRRRKLDRLERLRCRDSREADCHQRKRKYKRCFVFHQRVPSECFQPRFSASLAIPTVDLFCCRGL